MKNSTEGYCMQGFIAGWARKLAVLVLVAGIGLSSQKAVADISINVFYRDLSPYGQWFTHNLYGQVWQPYGISPGWRPYTEGRWIYTAAYGWYWQSDAPWGWAPFHYGRWAFDNQFGWLWVPGTVWAPAWVSWQYNDGYYAWAPLPPEIYWQPGSGLSFSYYNVTNIPPTYWVVVPQRHFIDHHVHQHILPAQQNYSYVHQQHNAYNNIAMNNNRIFNPGIPVAKLERDLHQRIPTVSLAQTDNLIARPVKNPNGSVQYFKPVTQTMDNAAAEREREMAVKIMQDTQRQRELFPGGVTYQSAPMNYGNAGNNSQWLGEQNPRGKGLNTNLSPNAQLDASQLSREQNARMLQQQVEQQQQQQALEQQRQQALQFQAQQQVLEQQRRPETQTQMARQREQEQQRQQELQLQAQQQMQEQQRRQETQQQMARQREQEQQRQQEMQLQAQQQLQEQQRRQEAQQQAAEQQRQLEQQQQQQMARQRDLEAQQQAAQQQMEQQRQAEQRMAEQQRQQAMQLQAQQQMLEQQRQAEAQQQQAQQQMLEQQRQAAAQQQAAQQQLAEQQRQAAMQQQQAIQQMQQLQQQAH